VLDGVGGEEAVLSGGAVGLFEEGFDVLSELLESGTET
jgi:ketol-acid reductoisomerase